MPARDGGDPERSETRCAAGLKKGRIVGKRGQDQHADGEGQAEAAHPCAEERAGTTALQAVPNEQAREQEEQRHEEAVVEAHEKIETDPLPWIHDGCRRERVVHPIDVAERAVRKRGVVKDHEADDEASHVIEGNQPFASPGGDGGTGASRALAGWYSSCSRRTRRLVVRCVTAKLDANPVYRIMASPIPASGIASWIGND